MKPQIRLPFAILFASMVASIMGCSSSTSVENRLNSAIMLMHSRSSDTTGVKDYYEETVELIGLNQRPVLGGMVTVNGSTLNALPHEYQNASSRKDLISERFDGTSQVINITGSSDFPTFIDSIPSPTPLANILSPTPTIKLSKSAGFNITWDYIKGSADTVQITISADSSIIGQQVPNSGSFFFSPASLTKLNPGAITIILMHSKDRDAHTSDGRLIKMSSYTATIVNTRLEK